MITAAIVFDYRNRTKKNEAGPLDVRLTIKRKPYYISTGVRVRREQWAFDRVINHPHANELNERLGIIVRKVMDAINKSLDEGKEIKVADIRRDIWHTACSSDFLVWMDDEIERLDIQHGTYKHYRTLSKRLHEWGQMQAWEDVTPNNIIAFDVWLRSRVYRSLPLSEAGRHNYHRNLRHLLYCAESVGKLQTNPYARLRGRFKRGDRESTEYLTDVEVEEIMKLKPAKGSVMEMAKDLFVFQLWTGLSYQDTQVFDFSKYKKIGGQYRLTAKRIKTGEPYVSQLLPPAVDVLKKYGMTTPKLINALYNKALHDIGIACGITTRLHSHIARHTFATYMLRHGVKLENVSRMLGHTNIRQTLRYAKVLAEDVHNDFDRINKLLESKMENAES